MDSINKIKKNLFLSIFSLLFAVIAFSQTGYACVGLCIPYKAGDPSITDDFRMKKYDNSVNYYSADGNSSSLTIKPTRIGFLKFNITNLKNEFAKGNIVNSAVLNLFGSGTGNISLYYVSDDKWVNESITKTNVTPTEMQSVMGSALITQALTSGENTKSFNFNDKLINLLRSNVSDIDDFAFSLALVADNSFTFSTSEPCSPCPPTLQVDYTPVPEPSSMMLGLLGLSSMFGFRKKHKKV